MRTALSTAVYHCAKTAKTGGYQFIAKYPDGSQDYGSFEVANIETRISSQIDPANARVMAVTRPK